MIKILQKKENNGKSIYAGIRGIRVDEGNYIYMYSLDDIIEKNQFDILAFLTKIGLRSEFPGDIQHVQYLIFTCIKYKRFNIANYLIALYGKPDTKYISDDEEREQITDFSILWYIIKNTITEGVFTSQYNDDPHYLWNCADYEYFVLEAKIFNNIDIGWDIQCSAMFGDIKSLVSTMHWANPNEISIYLSYIKENSIEVLLQCKNIDKVIYILPEKNVGDIYSYVELLNFYVRMNENINIRGDTVVNYNLFNWEAKKKRLDTVILLSKMGIFTRYDYIKTLKYLNEWNYEKPHCETSLDEDLEIMIRNNMYKMVKKYLYKDTTIYKECCICLTKKRQREEVEKEEDGRGELHEPLYPCGHNGYCQECIRDVTKCPRCRHDIIKEEEI